MQFGHVTYCIKANAIQIFMIIFLNTLFLKYSFEKCILKYILNYFLKNIFFIRPTLHWSRRALISQLNPYPDISIPPSCLFARTVQSSIDAPNPRLYTTTVVCL